MFLEHASPLMTSLIKLYFHPSDIALLFFFRYSETWYGGKYFHSYGRGKNIQTTILQSHWVEPTCIGWYWKARTPGWLRGKQNIDVYQSTSLSVLIYIRFQLKFWFLDKTFTFLYLKCFCSKRVLSFWKAISSSRCGVFLITNSVLLLFFTINDESKGLLDLSRVLTCIITVYF